MVPSASRSVRYGVPLGKAARATRTVSGGTGAMGCGRSDMTDVLIHVEACGQLLWGYYAIACVPRRTLSAPTTCLKAFEILQIIVRRQYHLPFWTKPLVGKNYTYPDVVGESGRKRKPSEV